MAAGGVQAGAARAASPNKVVRFIRYPLILMVLGFVLINAARIPAAVFQFELRPAATSPLRLVGAILDVSLVILIYWLFCRFIEAAPMRDLERRRSLRELCAGLAGGALLFSVVVAVVALLGGYRFVGWGSVASIWGALALSATSGVGEEILFRGILFRFIEKVGGSGIALAMTSALFGIAHLANNHGSPFASLAIALEAGVLLGAVYMLTRRLWAAIGVHAAWNFTQGWIFGIPVSGFDVPGIIRSSRPGSELLTGGDFGLEASVVAIVIATSAGVAMLYLAARRGNIVKPVWSRKREAAV